DLARLVRDLEADVRLAGDDLDDADADRRERTREVLREIADLAALHARRGLELEARDDGARTHGDDLGLDAEVGELELEQPRHRLERLGRVAADLGRRIVEQRQRRQLLRRRRLEQRHLLLALEPYARLDLLDDGLDARRRRLRLRPDLADRLLPAGAPPPALQPGSRALAEGGGLRE